MSLPGLRPAPPTIVKQHLVAALHRLQNGDYDTVVALCRHVLVVSPANFDAHYYLGVALGELGQNDVSIQHLRLAAKANPKSDEVRNNLGKALMNAGELQESLRVLAATAERAPHYEDAHVSLVQLLRKMNRDEEALHKLNDVVVRFPHSWALRNERGRILLGLDRNHEAALDFEAAAHLNSESADVQLNLSEALVRLKQHDAAQLVLEDLLRRMPAINEAKSQLIGIYRFLWQSEKALALAQQLAAANPTDPNLRLTVGDCLVDLGRTAEAEVVFSFVLDQTAIGSESLISQESTADMLVHALSSYAPIHKFAQGARELNTVDVLLARPELPEADRRTLLYVKSKIEDDIGNSGEAVRAALAAKVLSNLADDFERHRDFVHATIATFDRAFFDRHRNLGSKTDLPVFILGMPRSGTTLTEQIIASHPQADGSGEMVTLPDISHGLGFDVDEVTAFLARIDHLTSQAAHEIAERYLSALRHSRKPDALRITDKMPHNFQHIWLIALLFPNARIIHCRRNPVDVCMSIFLRNFSNGHWYTRDFETMGKFYNLYKESTAHWQSVCGLKWFDNDYEAMVADPEPHIRKMIDFLGLPWDDKCLAHTETERSVHTFSRWQVRQPIYKTSVERWRKYAPYIGPLLEELGIEA